VAEDVMQSKVHLTSEGNATYLRPYDDDRILFNMSVWESVESFAFTFKQLFPPDEAVIRATDWSGFEPCPAT
jgi:hypothetical protein